MGPVEEEAIRQEGALDRKGEATGHEEVCEVHLRQDGMEAEEAGDQVLGPARDQWVGVHHLYTTMTSTHKVHHHLAIPMLETFPLLPLGSRCPLVKPLKWTLGLVRHQCKIPIMVV
jgi:hypothetical protein